VYERGIGVPQDYAQAADLYRRAADKGDADAQFNLAILYDNGTGAPKNYMAAAGWYEKAAEQGLPRAQFNLGSMYANGQGTPVNLPEAYVWLALSAKTWSGSRQDQAEHARDLVAQHMSAEELEAAKQRVEKWLAERRK
jgi:TPR repeat protein